MSEKTDNILTLVSQELQPPYKCTSLTQLSGGTGNFVYRGILSQPLDGTKTIIIKHGEDYAASNHEFKLPTDRCLIEESMLEALNNVPATGNQNYTVKTPRLLRSNRATNTLILEDLPDALDLKSFMLSSPRSVPRDQATGIGRALGKWLLSFHDWVSQELKKDLVRAVEGNGMRDIKFVVNYDGLVERVDRFPDLLAECRGVFRQVREMAAAELGRRDGEGFGVIHGDFWTGNVLIPNTASQQRDIPLFVTDWELCHYGARALDLGQMIAELYELKHFRDIDAGVWLIEGLVDGYGPVTEDMAFRIAIHVGVHLVCWGSSVPGWGTDDQVHEVVRIGRDLVVKGWERDRAWFEGSWLDCLFKALL